MVLHVLSDMENEEVENKVNTNWKEIKETLQDCQKHIWTGQRSETKEMVQC